MTAIITYPATGRGAWPYYGRGGTLSADGRSLGSYYRAPSLSSVNMIGTQGFYADKNNTSVDIDHYATFMAVKAYQRFFGTTPDGLWGPNTDVKVKAWQTSKGLFADGVLGPVTSKAIFKPMAIAAAKQVNSAHLELQNMVCGTIGWESAWDAGAVGGSTPMDLGLGQINGPAHPNMTVDSRLTPETSLLWIANFVNNNLVYFKYNVRDAIAAYNLGSGGATSWIRAGRPDVWVISADRSISVKKYIDNVLASA